MRRFLTAAAFALLAAAPLAAHADTAADYNLFVTGNLKMQGNSVAGRTAVGGNAQIQSFSIANGVPANTQNLVVGGNLTANGGSVKGKIVTGGTASFTSFNSAQYQPGAAIPVNFSAEAARLLWLSDTLGDYAQTGTTNVVDYGVHGSQISLAGANSGLNVFTLNGAVLADTNTFTLNIKPGSTALINVSGTSGLFYGSGVNIIGGDASSVLWNFYEATNLNFYSIGVKGSVLAPLADYTPTGYGNIDGQVFVKSFTGDWSGGSTTVNNFAFKGDLLKMVQPVVVNTPANALVGGGVPEPATWTMMILGFGAIGSLLRRQRRLARV